ncbi:MAG: polysaccharide deacetylase family protein [Sphingomonadaceae bacterium]|nr:polysaccharide deacetylase family protein [Sphingomonadaceae bacterium]
MSGENILSLPGADQFASFDEDFGQRFLVTVDTEEEFDWDAPMGRTSHSLGAVPRLREFQAFCETRDVVPLYLIDYPIATSPEAIQILKPAAEDGRAEIGLHLHPWVSPPFNEELSDYNSYAGNLTQEQEREKFNQLRDVIEENFGVRPTIYRAGRYGAGPHTAAVLQDAGFLIDSSVRTAFDYSNSGGGPDFHSHPVKPYWIDQGRSLLELPVTTVFWGPLRTLGPRLFPLARFAARLPGLLARTGLLERIPLTPEGVTANEAIRAIDIAIDDCVPVLVFSFHSPSLAPGHTPYVKSDADLERFYAWWNEVFDYLEKRGIAPTTVGETAESVSLA